MDKNQFKGNSKDTTSKLHDATGKVSSGNDSQLKDNKKQVDGQSTRPVGDIKDATKNIGKK